jgi:hypothetical protein
MAQQFKVTELGGKRMNPLAGSTNLWKLSNDLCDCTSDPSCMDFANVAVGTAKTIASITVDGVVVPVTPTSTADVPALKEALETAIAKYENAPYFELVTNGTNLLIKHYGATVVSSIAWASGGPTTMTRSCELIQVCTFTGQDVGAITPLVVAKPDGTTESVALTGGPWAYSGTPATDDATAATLKTAIYNALVAVDLVGPDAAAGVNAIVVTRNDDDDAYDIVIPRLQGARGLTSLGDTFVKSNCMDDFRIV